MTRFRGDSIGMSLSLLLGVVVFATADPVILDVTFKCEIPEPWCAEIYIYDVDSAPDLDDPWVYGRVCTENPEYTFEFDAMWPRGDGVLENYYEAETLIYHNCTIFQLEWEAKELAFSGIHTEHVSKKCDCISPSNYKDIKSEGLNYITETYEMELSDYLIHELSIHCYYPSCFYKPQQDMEKRRFPKKYQGTRCEWFSENYNKSEAYYWIDHRFIERSPLLNNWRVQ